MGDLYDLLQQTASQQIAEIEDARIFLRMSNLSCGALIEMYNRTLIREFLLEDIVLHPDMTMGVLLDMTESYEEILKLRPDLPDWVKLAMSINRV